MKHLFQRGLTLLIALTVLAALVWAFLPKPVAVDVGTVTRGPLQVTVDEDGVTRIRERYEVSSPLTGRLRRVALKAGHAVRAGETLLAVIEPSDPQLLDARTRMEAEARLRAAEAAVRQTMANVERTEAAQALAEIELRRTRDLVATGVLSQSQLDLAETAARTGTEELKAARFAAQIARFEAEQAQAVLNPFGGNDGSSPAPFEIRAPIDGRVLRVWQESATTVLPGTRLLELGDPADLEIVIDVLSADGVKIRPGATMYLEHWGGTRSLEARVRLVEPSAFLKVSALGVEEQRVNVIGDLVDPPEERPTLGDAFRVEARIVIWEEDNVIKVPTSALFRQDDGWAVFVSGDGRAVLRRVELGHQNGLESEARDGLAEGERVVLHPGDRLRDGIAVHERKL